LPDGNIILIRRKRGFGSGREQETHRVSPPARDGAPQIGRSKRNAGRRPTRRGRSARLRAVEHSKDEYVRGNAHTNTVEGFFSIFKRGMKGVYQHCGKRHLHRYVAEFDVCYSNREANGVDDGARAGIALNGVVGKRVLYRDSFGA
jgi:hypothetical protein